MQLTVYTINEVATILKVHPQTIYELIKEAGLSAIKVRGQWRITEDALDEYLESRTVKVSKRKIA